VRVVRVVNKGENGNLVDQLPKIILQAARRLRREQTDTELFFWNIVRNRSMGGYKFRRQKPIGPYIVDFCCVEKKLVVEFDGSGHNEKEQKQHDSIRDDYLRKEGFEVKRYWNNLLYQETRAVLEDIWCCLNAR
jgi:very-short-patch-repair endonuclease